MKKILFLGIFFTFTISNSSFATITYSGPQNITVDLSNSAVIDFDGAGTIWYPFTISLQDMTSGSQTYRTLLYDIIGNTLVFYNISSGYIPGLGQKALNIGFADPIPPTPPWGSTYDAYLTAVDLSTLVTFGEFNPATPSGYIGLNGLYDSSGTLHFYHGWLHISITDFGLTSMQATIDGWAYEDQNKVPIAAGNIPAPGTFILSIFGAGMVAYLRKRRTI